MRLLHTVCLFGLLGIFPVATSAVEGTRVGEASHGVLLSRIGYDLAGEKRIVVRATAKDWLTDGAELVIRGEHGAEVWRGEVKAWGEKWRSHWWIADFSALKIPGRFVGVVRDQERDVLVTPEFEVRENLLWEKTWKTVALAQLDARIELRNRNVQQHGPEYAQGGGWQDCGSYLREVNSHATMITGLLDLLEFSTNRIEAKDREAIVEQAGIGLEYIAFCQDKARALGKGEGAILHEWPKHTNVITGDTALGALCFARAGRLLAATKPGKARDYLRRAERSFRWLDEHGPVLHPGGTDFGGVEQPDDGFDRLAHGAPAGFVRPDEWMTRDLVTMLWCAVELARAGESTYRDAAAGYARKIMARQIPPSQAEGGFHGHFRAYASAGYSEKAWIHHHMGYDAGGTFPHYLIPLIAMTTLWPEHPDAADWRRTVRDFAYGYFLPACNDNPFRLLPAGYFEGEGLLTFSGLWHGMNGAYGSAAALALELEQFTGDARFRAIAMGNLQWIAGLNSGVAENDRFVAKSMIYGLGDEFIGSWTKIPGAVCNGFEADKQFVFTEPSAAEDGPFYFTDEDWITHSGGWLSALSRFSGEGR